MGKTFLKCCILYVYDLDFHFEIWVFLFEILILQAAHFTKNSELTEILFCCDLIFDDQIAIHYEISMTIQEFTV